MYEAQTEHVALFNIDFEREISRIWDLNMVKYDFSKLNRFLEQVNAFYFKISHLIQCLLICEIYEQFLSEN